MTTDTKTYPFGETPVEVIRDRYYALVAARSLPLVIRGWSLDNLITVLDALASQVKRLEQLAADKRVALSQQTAALAKAAPIRKLRIEILAALGVTEQ